jgi:transposase
MAKRKDFKLSEEDLKGIEKVIAHDERCEVVKRAMALRLLHYGQHPEDVAEMLVVTGSTIYNWHQRWESEGLAGLANHPKSGRPRKADASTTAVNYGS